MYRPLFLLPLFAFAPITPGADAPPAPKTEAVAKGFHQVKLNGHTFTLPEGFTIELAAGPPLADRPIVAALDEKGRLYVCDSSGSNDKVTEQMKTKPHRILRLEDTDGDGKYDKSTLFVANVMFPEGAMWLNGSLYVAAVPNILKFTDTDGDGKADKEEIWFDGTKVSKTVGGCANDLHGPYLGPDGWIYWCKGGFEKQDYTIHGKPFTTRISHIFRARPDGTGIEPVMTGGMDNPVDVVFTPSGERIFSCTFLQHPANGKRDGLIHAVYGAVYGKDHPGVYEHPWTSPKLMEPMTHLGPAAPCGLHRYESDQFGKEFENNLFCCQFNLRKVSRHMLVPSGSTFTTKDSDFVVSDQHDFHPTDVIEDADGSLLILDTGGWYKLCCPSSQLVKPDVKGAIYRVKKTGAHKVADARGEKIDWAKLKPEELVKLLDDPRPVVWWKAINALAAKGAAVVKSLPSAMNQDASFRSRLGAIWTLARIDDPAARVANRGFITDGIGDVRQAALHVASLLRDESAVEALKAMVADQPLALTSAKDRRLAAEALGRIGDPLTIPTIFEALADEKNDRTLDHALTYALIEIGAPKTTEKGIKSKSPRVRRAVFAALDQMPGGMMVLDEPDSTDASLRETVWWIAGRHPEFSDLLAGYFEKRFARIETLTATEQEELCSRSVPFLKSRAIRDVLGNSLAANSNRAILHAMARSGLKSFPAEWKDGLKKSIGSADKDTVRDAIAVLRAVPPNDPLFRSIIAGVKTKLPLDLDYALQSAAGVPLGDEESIEVIPNLHRDKDKSIRAAAVDLLRLSGDHPDFFIALASALKTVNPFELPQLLPIFSRSTNEKVGLAFVAALADPKVMPTIRTEVVKPILDKYPKAVRDAAEALYAKLAEARKGETAKLERLLKELPAGDIRRGQAIFNGAKAQCAACHKIGYVGGQIGPDLTRIGGIRTERDLLEAIVFPSASFVRSYEPVRVTTLDGRVFNGIVKKDAPDEIILTIAADKEERLARADVENITPGTVSVMPDGFDKQVTPQELADLVAFLRACK